MKISYNWLKAYIQFDFDAETLAEKLTSVGLEIEEINSFSNYPDFDAGLMTAEVLEVSQHPNADRLRLTKVNIGIAEPLHIVCGAPNVAEGQKVIVATIGTKLQPTSGDAFVIKKSKIRGELSEGMICAEDEIGLGASHEGIMVLPPETPVGISLKEYFEFYKDEVLEIGLTPNRVDAACHVGVTRDLAALTEKPLTIPSVHTQHSENAKPCLEIKIEDAEACPQYSGYVIHDIQVKPSPQWLQNKLKAVGLKPINNVVDVTNFVMYEIGQPIHAFDLNEIKGSKIIIKRAKANTKFTTLDKATHTLNGEELLICNAEAPMALAGIFGGLQSGIKDTTTSIFIESAYFNPAVIRKTSRRLGIFTDASFRYERGADPNSTVYAAQRALQLILELAGGQSEGYLYNLNPTPYVPIELQFNYAYLEQVAGIAIEKERVKTILTHLGFDIKNESETGLNIIVPSFKPDVTRPIDVVEEVLRIYSYNNIPISHNIRSIIQLDPLQRKELIKTRLSQYLVDNGFFESVMLSFVAQEVNEMYPSDLAVKVLNPISADLSELRTNMMWQGLKVLEHNINRKHLNNKFFSWGKEHSLKDGKYIEKERLSIWLTGNDKEENWHDKVKKADFYHLKGLCIQILNLSGIADYEIEEVTDDNFEYGLKYLKASEEIFTIGKLDAERATKFGIEQDCFYAVFNAPTLFSQEFDQSYRSYSKFPKVERDLALEVPKDVKYEDIQKLIYEIENKLISKVLIFDVYQGTQVKAGYKSYAIRIVFENPEQTLEDKIVERIMTKLVNSLENTYKINIRH